MSSTILAKKPIVYPESCFAMAERVSLNFDDFTCRAEGILEKLEGKGFRFTKMDLYPELTIGDEEEEEWAKRVLEMSKNNCLVINSMTSEVTLNSMIRSKGK